MSNFFTENTGWIVIAAYVALVILIVYAVLNRMSKEYKKFSALEKIHIEIFLASVFIIILVPLKYLVAAACFWWIKIRIKMAQEIEKYEKNERTEEILMLEDKREIME